MINTATHLLSKNHFSQKQVDKSSPLVYNSIASSNKNRYVQYAFSGYFACGEDIHALRLTSKLVDLRAGYAKRIRRARLAAPHLIAP